MIYSVSIFLYNVVYQFVYCCLLIFRYYVSLMTSNVYSKALDIIFNNIIVKTVKCFLLPLRADMYYATCMQGCVCAPMYVCAHIYIIYVYNHTYIYMYYSDMLARCTKRILNQMCYLINCKCCICQVL